MNSLLALILVFLSSQVEVPTAPTISITNTFGEPILLWFKPDVTGVWFKPPLSMQKGETKKIYIQYHGKYLMRVQDFNKRYCPAGESNLAELSKILAGKPMELDVETNKRKQTIKVTEYRTEERARVYTITKPVWETRTKEMQFFDPMTGQIYIATVEYKTCKNVPEQRTETYSVRVPTVVEKEIEVEEKQAVAKVTVNGKRIPLQEFLRDYKKKYAPGAAQLPAN